METVNDSDPPTATPPPTGTPPSGHRPPRLTRSTGDKVVAGVAGGLGSYFGVDPVVFRIAFVVLTLAGGSGVLLYLLGWLVIPDDTGRGPLNRVGRERDQKLVAAVLIGAALLIVMDHLTSRDGGDIPVGLVLVGIGALVLWSRRDHDGPGGDPYQPPPPPPPPPPVAGDEPAEPTTSFAATTSTPPTATGPVAGPVAEPVAAKPRRPRSVLVPVTLSLLAILAGGLSLLAVSATTGVALALLLTGAALVVGGWRGRARWLIPVGLILALALAAVSIVDVPVRGGTGDVAFRPLTPADVRSPYRLAAGHLTVDLSALHLDGTTLTVVASVAAGEVQVIVPADATVDVDAHTGVGNLDLLGHLSDGLDVGRHVSESGVEGGGHLVLRGRAGAGRVEVRRAAP